MTAVGVFLFVSCLQGAVQESGLLITIRGWSSAPRAKLEQLPLMKIN